MAEADDDSPCVHQKLSFTTQKSPKRNLCGQPGSTGQGGSPACEGHRQIVSPRPSSDAGASPLRVTCCFLFHNPGQRRQPGLGTSGLPPLNSSTGLPRGSGAGRPGWTRFSRLSPCPCPRQVALGEPLNLWERGDQPATHYLGTSSQSARCYSVWALG